MDVMVLRRGGLGDVIMAEPLLRALRASPEVARLDFVCLKRYAWLYRRERRTDSVVPLDESAWIAPHRVHPVPSLPIDPREYTHALVLERDKRFLHIVRTLLEPHCGVDALQMPIGHETRGRRDVAHRVEAFLSLLATLGLPYQVDFPRLATLAELPAGGILDSGTVALVPAGGFVPGHPGHFKRWPIHCFAQLGAALVSKGFHLSLVGGEENRELLKLLSKMLPGSATCTYLKSDSIVEVLSTCDCVIGNDTGWMHFAHAIGRRLLDGHRIE